MAVGHFVHIIAGPLVKGHIKIICDGYVTVNIIDVIVCHDCQRCIFANDIQFPRGGIAGGNALVGEGIGYCADFRCGIVILCVRHKHGAAV